MKNDNKIRALGLCSGGLDSMLSALVLKDQGIEVEWISFETPFFSSDKARQAASRLKIPITVKHITSVYLKMLKNPPAGYGKNLNPCMDCHTLMFKLAGEMIKTKGFKFLFSGEVLGQRPMSQTKPALRYVEKHSGYDGYIVRPLSAKLLPETIPEKKGWIDRNQLLDLMGRSRKPQIELAKKYHLKIFPSPAGGCLLTDKGFSNRLKDLFDHQSAYPETDLNLLKLGRHIRLNKNSKIVVGRSRQDNELMLKHYRPDKDFLIKMKKVPGPTVLLPYGGSKEIVALSASICAGYGKASKNQKVEVYVNMPDGRNVLNIIPLDPKHIKQFII